MPYIMTLVKCLLVELVKGKKSLLVEGIVLEQKK